MPDLRFSQRWIWRFLSLEGDEMLRMNVLLHLTIYGLEFGGNVNYCELWG
jgi:hypothetical protein